MTIKRNQVREIRALVETFAGIMAQLRAHTDAPTADDRTGDVIIGMERDLIRRARRALDELVALDGRSRPAGRLEGVSAPPSPTPGGSVAATGPQPAPAGQNGGIAQPDRRS